MKLLINVRYLLVAFVGIALGIFSAYLVLFGKGWLLLVAFLIVSGGILLCALRKNKLYVVFVVMLLCFLLGCGLFSVQFNKYYNDFSVDCTLTGRVTDLSRNTTKQVYVLYLDDCTYHTKDNSEETKVNGVVRVSYFMASEVEVGNVVTMRGNLSTNHIFGDGVNTWCVRYKVFYNFDVDAFFDSSAGSLKTDEKCRKFVYESLCENLSSETSGVAYALLTGDRADVEGETMQAFRTAGVIHLLAVSGLHLGFVVSLLGIILNRFRLKNLTKLLILCIPLLFYGYVCAFSASVIRAFVMICAWYLVEHFHGCQDMLSSLCLAGVVILIIQPLYLFDFGFILSFLSVYGIATFATAVKRLYTKKKLPKPCTYLLDSAGVSVGATLSTSCAVGAFFGKIPLLGVLLNIVAIPIVSLAFSLLFVGLVPFLNFLLVVPDFLLGVTLKMANFVSQLSFSALSVGNVALTAVLMVVLLFVIGGFVNVKGKAKNITCVALCVLVATTFVFGLLPQKCHNQIDVKFSYGQICVVALSEQNHATVVCNFADSYSTSLAEKSLRFKRVEKCDVVITDFSATDLEAFKQFEQVAKVSKVYVLSPDGNTSVERHLGEQNVSVVHVPKNEAFGSGITCRSLYDGALVGCVVTVGQVRLGIAFCDDAQLNAFLEHSGNVTALATLNVSQKLMDSAKSVVLSQYQTNYYGNYGANKYGNFTIKEKNGKITLTV